jgi:tRNA pseudouridine32 synthase
MSIKPSYFRDAAFVSVKPYFFEFKTFTKDRWVGKSISEIFKSEFEQPFANYIDKALERGNITVNGKNVEGSYALNNSDLITHRIHRHEPKISSSPITVLHLQDNIMIVDKPFSIPVHPTGHYNFNSLTEILKFRFQLKFIAAINRIDRLVSGIVILALNSDASRELHTAMEQRKFKKEYICVIEGRFPDHKVCEESICIKDHKRSIVHLAEDGKPSKTLFKRIDFNGVHSIVHCQPITGRQHQIRAHISNCGFSIVGDHKYEGAGDSDATVKPCSDCMFYKEFENQNAILLHAFRYVLPDGTEIKTQPPDWLNNYVNSMNYDRL